MTDELQDEKQAKQVPAGPRDELVTELKAVAAPLVAVIEEEIALVAHQPDSSPWRMAAQALLAKLKELEAR